MQQLTEYRPEYVPPKTDLIWCYGLIFGLVDISFCNLFELRSVTRGHPYKIFKHHYSCTVRSSFFLSVFLVIWNSVLSDVVDFSSLASFKRSINSVDFSKYLVD